MTTLRDILERHGITVDPVADIFLMMTADELRNLAYDTKVNGELSSSRSDGRPHPNLDRLISGPCRDPIRVSLATVTGALCQPSARHAGRAGPAQSLPPACHRVLVLEVHFGLSRPRSARSCCEREHIGD
jgi:hypothetical protein